MLIGIASIGIGIACHRRLAAVAAAANGESVEAFNCICQCDRRSTCAVVRIGDGQSCGCMVDRNGAGLA